MYLWVDMDQIYSTAKTQGLDHSFHFILVKKGLMSCNLLLLSAGLWYFKYLISWTKHSFYVTVTHISSASWSYSADGPLGFFLMWMLNIMGKSLQVDCYLNQHEKCRLLWHEAIWDMISNSRTLDTCVSFRSVFVFYIDWCTWTWILDLVIQCGLCSHHLEVCSMWGSGPLQVSFVGLSADMTQCHCIPSVLCCIHVMMFATNVFHLFGLEDSKHKSVVDLSRDGCCWPWGWASTCFVQQMCKQNCMIQFWLIRSYFLVGCIPRSGTK
jgi:hypothetical protein